MHDIYFFSFFLLVSSYRFISNAFLPRRSRKENKPSRLTSMSCSTVLMFESMQKHIQHGHKDNMCSTQYSLYFLFLFVAVYESLTVCLSVGSQAVEMYKNTKKKTNTETMRGINVCWAQRMSLDFHIPAFKPKVCSNWVLVSSSQDILSQNHVTSGSSPPQLHCCADEKP